MEGVHPSSGAAWIRLGVVVLGFALSAQAVALTSGGVDGHGYVPPAVDPAVSSPLTVLSPFNDRLGAWSFGGVIEHVQAPLVEYRLLTPGEPTEVALLDDVYGVNLGGRVPLHQRVGLAAVLPVWIAAGGDAGCCN